jgi:aminopeptidase
MNGVSVEVTPLVRLIVKKAYQEGAKLVDIMWDDDQVRLYRYKYASKDSFEEYPTWRSDGALQIAKQNDAMLFIMARDPDVLSEVDSNLILTSQKAYLKHMKPANDLRRKNLVNWSGIIAPVEGWAKKIFPEISQKERLLKFWDVVFDICRVKRKDPVLEWQNHIDQLIARCSILNKKKFSSLHFRAPGTNLTIGLPEGHIWKSAHFTTQGGISNVVNIPTEEVFTTPHKDKINGTITATKPLFRESLVEGLSLTVVKGKVEKVTATKGEDYIGNIIKTDEGAFYNTLIDENASCHLALGSGIKACLDKGVTMSDEEFSSAGGNISTLHIDFMIGSEEMDVDGINEDGTSEPVMRKGELVF